MPCSVRRGAAAIGAREGAHQIGLAPRHGATRAPGRIGLFWNWFYESPFEIRLSSQQQQQQQQQDQQYQQRVAAA